MQYLDEVHSGARDEVSWFRAPGFRVKGASSELWSFAPISATLEVI